MALSPLEKVFAFYTVLDRRIEALPELCAIFPHDTPTSFAIEKDALLQAKRAKDPSYLMEPEAQRYLGLGSRAEAAVALDLRHEWKRRSGTARDVLVQHVVQTCEQKDKPLVEQFMTVKKDLSVLRIASLNSPYRRPSRRLSANG